MRQLRTPDTTVTIDTNTPGASQSHEVHRRLGAHLTQQGRERGVRFAVWAPNAERVNVIGDFNGWNTDANPMQLSGDHGVWHTFVPDLAEGALYKYAVHARGGQRLEKADPFAFGSELRPATASVVRDLTKHSWNDEQWMSHRHRWQAADRPMSIYEVHLGSWMSPRDGQPFPNYRELAHELVRYAQKMGYTHLELMPIGEHPFDASWGYQSTGYFAPTSRFGTPADFMYFVDYCHQHSIGVILDWVPGHFPRDGFALAGFDGTCLYEHHDARLGFHPHWGTLIFNHGRDEVRSFLLSSAMFWCENYHLDGFRVDAVASMLYLDYGREAGGWVPNRHGGNGNLEAMEFLRDFNELVHQYYPGVLTIAEESTAWPNVSRPADSGGLGFSMKWNMGWMNDTLRYFRREPVHRRWHQNDLTFSMLYAWSENFILPFSHDEVVHGKGSLLARMPGDDWQKFAGLRLLLGYMFAHPGKKLLFMGNDLAMWHEWNDRQPLDFGLLNHEPHAGVNRLVQDLNRLHQHEPALHELDFAPEGFEWVDCSDADNSAFAFIRRAKNRDDFILAIANFTPVVRHGYRIGVPESGFYREVLNTDAADYWGSGVGNKGGVWAQPVPCHGRGQSLELALPPLSLLLLKPSGLPGCPDYAWR
ncbi:MAG: 1,4-alpha-glucan branching protein GlgB [Planctomycetes bacterium]|nr:1,4-alpha-glucan branching protein GlgB [Planctomycetota bacterium]